MLHSYFKKLYRRTMTEAYGLAFKEIVTTLENGGHCLDCGAAGGGYFEKIGAAIPFDPSRYHGIEWSAACVQQARRKGLNIVRGDLNRPLPYDDNGFRCVFALSVLGVEA